MQIPQDKINYRTEFNRRERLGIACRDYPLQELKKSIQEHGLLNPILVRKMGNGRYKLLDGLWRLLALEDLTPGGMIEAHVTEDVGNWDQTRCHHCKTGG